MMPDDNPVNDQRISLFLRKLWTLVCSQETDNVIKWSEDGDSFIINNPVEFCKVLPRYFKHNNFMSFVRQLHIYGFSKRISDVDHTSNHGTSCEYAHPYFMKEHPCLLLSIKQKRGEKLHQGIKTDIDSIETISTLLKEVNSVKDKNKMLDSKFTAMKHENECLWRELAVIRQKHMKQQRILNQLIQFLVTLRQPSTNNTLCREVKNNVRYVLPIMHHKASEKTNSGETFTNPKYKPSTSSGPVIHELDAADVLNSNEDSKIHQRILNEAVEPEGVVLSPSSVSQMLSSPGGSTVEEVFAPNEIIMNSPLDDLIREVSVSPTEELFEPKTTIVTVPSFNPVTKINKTSNKISKKRTKKDINPSKKKKINIADNVQNQEPTPSAVPYIIKVEPMGDDPPVISIPDMDFVEPEVTISNNDDLWNNETTSNSDNMQLANPEPREAVSKQIDLVQADLESLLKGLNDKYTFDANMFLNFINDDPTNLNLPITSEEQTLNDAKNGLNVTPDNQIVSCLSPNTYDLNDLMTASADWTIPNTPMSFDSSYENDVLNTPVITDSLLNTDSLYPSISSPEK
ncbi:heat shock factor protein isoform X2 [Rhopalosiphum padi]|uniref:heat shock factor protein isoform X2 n=1 Tax=Rhopalosiphum padi TaxID=40932 RepID=UPI00298E0C3B|nr:heat shock factor protein isoform X2 [Rhopalosiphum padi]